MDKTAWKLYILQPTSKQSNNNQQIKQSSSRACERSGAGEKAAPLSSLIL